MEKPKIRMLVNYTGETRLAQRPSRIRQTNLHSTYESSFSANRRAFRQMRVTKIGLQFDSLGRRTPCRFAHSGNVIPDSIEITEGAFVPEPRPTDCKFRIET